MAKKQSSDTPEAAAPAAEEPKKTDKKAAKDKKADGDKGEKPPRPEKGEKADKGDKGKGDKGKPEPARAEGDGKEAKPTAAAAAAAAAGEPSKTKGKRPGKGPGHGKKLKKKIKEQQTAIARNGPVGVPQAVEQLKKFKRVKFDETVEVHMSLGVDVTQSDQLVRGTVSLPHGIGKSVRVLVFCQGENVAKAKEAGADHAGSDELIKKIQQEGWTDFDVALATQDMMGQVSRLGKVLGPRGLMPTPKAGTVVTGDIAAAVKEFKAGKVEYRTDKTGNVHAGVGKLSFDERKLVDNITTFVDQVKNAKPTGVRGNYVLSIYVSATMSPGIPVLI